MTAARYARLAEIVPHALDLAADDRDAFLDHACTLADGTRDDALLTEVRALLVASHAALTRAAAAATSLARPLAAAAARLADLRQAQSRTVEAARLRIAR